MIRRLTLVPVPLALVLTALASCASLAQEGAGPAAARTAPSGSPAADKANRVTFYLGGRRLDEDLYEPVEDQAVFGIEYARERPGSALGFEIGLQGGADEDQVLGTDIESRTSELYLGLRKSIPTGSIVRPVFGAGLSLIAASVDVSGFGDDDDGSLAGYAHAGVDFDFTEHFFLGLDLRGLFGSDIELAGVEGDADYVQLALAIGFAF